MEKSEEFKNNSLFLLKVPEWVYHKCITHKDSARPLYMGDLNILEDGSVM
jgi:hypothetical protein